MSGFLIPETHDCALGDHVARWRLLEKASPLTWDAQIGGSWHRPPVLPQYAPLIEALTAAGIDPHVVEWPTHGDSIQQLRVAAADWAVPDAAAAFVAGLWSAPAAWRAVLLGVLIERQLPEHPFTPWSNSVTDLCQVCGYRDRPQQLVAAWSSYLTEGTPLDGEPSGYAQALAWLAAERPEPTEYDRWALGAIISVIRSLPAGSRYTAAAKAITAAKILPDKRAVNAVLEDLALIGVLAPTDRPGMWEKFTTYRERDQRPNIKVEVQAPLAWWDTTAGDAGIRTEVVDAIFGPLNIPPVHLDAPRPAPHPALKDLLSGGLSARMRRLVPKADKPAASTGSGPAAAGDVWAIRIQPGKWVTVYLHEVQESGRPYAYAEFLAGTFPEMPTAKDIVTAVQPRRTGRSATWVHSIEKRPWMRRIAQAHPAPTSQAAYPEGGSWGAAKELRHLADWHYAR
ncbi:hypothetical protein JOF28_001782 [Leucobacter exalbidus]|uniref:Uncharacterized protein n=1 Tax=Leucobacter exalbidus TaxID=662960 RepID=A0A940T162_9MICO|nr:hypothetical protein [Leucobacter exalbidus]MBP1326550.1 hypothetical protein [Leucobacter exalbidus]